MQNKHKIMKNIANVGEYVIEQADSGSIKVYKEYSNTKGALREIAEEIGFEYDNSWTTRQFGTKLIQNINKK